MGVAPATIESCGDKPLHYIINLTFLKGREDSSLTLEAEFSSPKRRGDRGEVGVDKIRG